MAFIHERLDVTPQGYTSQHEQVLSIASKRNLTQYFNVKDRWVDSQNDLVLYELTRDGGPGHRNGEFVLFIGSTTIQFTCYWPTYAFDNYHCEARLRDDEEKNELELNSLHDSITKAIRAYFTYESTASGGALDEFSISWI